MTCYFKRAKTIDVFCLTPLPKKQLDYGTQLTLEGQKSMIKEMCKETKIDPTFTNHAYICKATKMFQARVPKD